MYKLWASIYKEFLLLIRDVGGLTILFVMPLVLVITITLIQDSSFKSVQQTKIPILIVDNNKVNINSDVLKEINTQVMIAIEEADIVVFVVDVETGINSMDNEISRLLHKSNKQVLLAVNKVDNSKRQLDSTE